MDGEFKLLRHVNNVPHFASVCVKLEGTKSGVDASDDVAAPDWKMAEVGRPSHNDWIDAAVTGARFGAQTLVEQGHLTGCRVVVTCVVGTECDTRPADVWCAAALATFHASCPEVPTPSLYFKNEQWHISWENATAN